MRFSITIVKWYHTFFVPSSLYLEVLSRIFPRKSRPDYHIWISMTMNELEQKWLSYILYALESAHYWSNQYGSVITAKSKRNSIFIPYNSVLAKCETVDCGTIEITEAAGKLQGKRIATTQARIQIGYAISRVQYEKATKYMWHPYSNIVWNSCHWLLYYKRNSKLLLTHTSRHTHLDKHIAENKGVSRAPMLETRRP